MLNTRESKLWVLRGAYRDHLCIGPTILSDAPVHDMMKTYDTLRVVSRKKSNLVNAEITTYVNKYYQALFVAVEICEYIRSYVIAVIMKTMQLNKECDFIMRILILTV